MTRGCRKGRSTAPWLRTTAAGMGERIALVCEDGETSFAELDGSADRIAGCMVRAGLSRGDRVALLMGASRRFVEIVHAAQRAGLIVVPLNERLTAGELEKQLLCTEPTWLLHDAGHVDSARFLGARFAAMRVVDAADDVDRMAPSWGVIEAPVDPDAVLTIMFTSGTTAASKGVMLSNRNHAASAEAVASNLGCTSGDRWLAAMPLYHVGGFSILVRAALCGFTVVLHPSFDARRANRAVYEQGVTIASLVPTMLSGMLDSAGGDAYPQSFRCAVLGGGPIEPWLVARARQMGVPVVVSYGLTETSSQVTATSLDYPTSGPGSAGKPLAGVELRIAEPDAAGVGEILVRGDQVTSGYWGSPEATREALAGGWLHTGDLGRIDEAGNLYVDTRRTDLIVSGGENVVPDEVEALLTGHPDILDAGVFAVADAHWGQCVAAAVVLRPGADVDTPGLATWCRGRVAGYKVPRAFYVVDALPRTAPGKLQRHRLKALVADAESSAEAVG